MILIYILVRSHNSDNYDLIVVLEAEETVTQAPQFTIGDIRGGIPVNFHTNMSQMTAGEVIIQHDGMQVHHTEEVKYSPHITAMGGATLTELRVHQGELDVNHRGVVIVAPSHQNNDDDDVMLEDLPIGQTLRDRLEPQQVVDDGRLDSANLPSISNMQSIEIDPEFFNNVAKNMKLHADSAGATNTKVPTRGKQLVKK